MGRGLLTTFVFLAGVNLLHGQTTFTNSTTISIPTGGTAPIVPSPYPSNISVSGMTGTISKVTLTLSNMAVNSADLDMMLVAPDGKKLVFLSDSGSGALLSGVSITIDDSAANQAPPTGSTSWTNGATYRPTNNVSGDTFPSPAPSFNATTESASGVSNTGATGTLALFNGINPNGTWSLYVVDDVPDSGVRTIGGWSITITTALANAPTNTIITSTVNPSFTSGAGSSVTFIATVTSGGNPVTVGTVNFLNGATAIASNVPLNGSGQASTTTTITSEGLFTISANYSGATGFGSSSGNLIQEVNNPTTISGNLFCNPGSVTISPSSNPYPQKIFVSGLSGTLSTVKVRLNGLTHSFPVDIDALLVAPDPMRKMQIMSDTGATGNIILDDAAANLLTASTVAGGTFRPTDLSGAGNETFPAPAPGGSYSLPAPTGGATLNSTFGGVNPNGAWTLYLVDDVPGAENASMSGGYCLDFTTTADLLTTTTVTSSADPATVGQNVTFTATVRRADNNALVTSGTVTFREGATTLAGPTALNASGQASFSTSSLSEGSHTISASYNGVAGSFNISNGTVTIQVDTATTVNGKTYCNPGGITNTSGTSPTAPQYPSRILVSNLAGSIATVTASFNSILQAFPADFDMMLV
ncbi:MAG: Ig-like domain repeat protein, partial [Bryobacterales bacterium]|nr:Ig-like domain repeat protein [Bryobacterales bacterium]